jgi:hypothetical protein
MEKVAEFNQLSSTLSSLDGKALAIKLAMYRNERIALAQRTYGISDSIYHIVGRSYGKLLIFNDQYKMIDIDHIRKVNKRDKSIVFDDGQYEYSYNFSKSTLYRRFAVPNDVDKIDVDILSDPFEKLLSMFPTAYGDQVDINSYRPREEYVVLPLYSTRGGRHVQERSALNQWNAKGRARDLGEVYIPIPLEVHRLKNGFFPDRDVEFSLSTPTGQVLRAKICQDNSKALMTNPNRDLSDWLLRKVLGLKDGELATIERLDTVGMDSVIVKRVGDLEYSIDVAKVGSYESFIKSL